MDLSEHPRDDTAAIRLIQRAVDLGVALIDTADRYGDGHNEQLLGRALLGRRSAVRLCTKIGFVGRPGDRRPVDNTPAHLRRAVHASLRRLATDHVDVLLLHRVDPLVPLEESIGALAELQQQGFARQVGVSEVGPRTLAAAHTIHPIDVVQVEYSLASRDLGDTLLPLCRSLSVELHASSPLGIGLLGLSPAQLDAGHVHRRLQRVPRGGASALAAHAEPLTALGALAAELGCTAPQLALAWLLHREAAVVPLPGTRRLDHLEQNLAATAIELDSDLIDELDRQFPVGRFTGARKSAAQIALTLP